MMPSTMRPNTPRLPLVLAASFAITLGACGGGGEQTDATIEEAPEVVTIEPTTDAATTDATQGEALDVVTNEDAPVVGGGWQSLQDDWMSSVPSVQARFGELTEEELIATGGDREQLVVLVQEKYRLEPAEAEQQVSDFEATL